MANKYIRMRMELVPQASKSRKVVGTLRIIHAMQLLNKLVIDPQLYITEKIIMEIVIKNIFHMWW